MTARKDCDRLVRIAVRAGWSCRPTRKGLALYPPDGTGTPVHVHTSPSDVRAALNLRSDLRRRGLRV